MPLPCPYSPYRHLSRGQASRRTPKQKYMVGMSAVHAIDKNNLQHFIQLFKLAVALPISLGQGYLRSNKKSNRSDFIGSYSCSLRIDQNIQSCIQLRKDELIILCIKELTSRYVLTYSRPHSQWIVAAQTTISSLRPF